VAFWLEEENSLFSGDCVLGHGTCVFDELYSYMHSLHRLLDLAKEKGLGAIYPGHGDLLKKDQSTKSIETYIKHRLEREEQVFEVLQSGGKWTPLQIVHAVYEDLPRGVVMSAQFNVEHHLDKLQREGKVTSSFGFWQATKTTAT
jgi:glyoxylase-like metal-dependent hydrolase (beta-lactamase superfamily II)